MTALIDILERHPCLTGSLGSVATFSASVVTAIQTLDPLLRFATLAAGLASGVLTALFMWERWLAAREARKEKRTKDLM